MNKKYLLSIAVLVFAIVGFMAFKPASKVAPPVKEKRTATPTWYNYIGAQTAIERAKKSNYVKLTAPPQNCTSSPNNECAVELSDDFGTNPTSASITFDGTTGMPVVGGHVLQNRTKGL